MKFVELDYELGKLRGFLYEPEQEKYDLVINFHGFTGSKIDNQHMGTLQGKEMVKHGVGYLAFDFYGSGDSDGLFHEMTLTREIEQAKSIINYAKSLSQVNKLVVCGHSMGGLVSLNAIDNDIDKLVLMAPALKMNELSRDIIKDLKFLEEYNAYDLGGILLSNDFIEDILDSKHYNFVDFNGPILIIHGTDDEACNINDSREFAKKHSNAKLVELENIGHCYNDYQVRLDNIKLIANFVKENK